MRDGELDDVDRRILYELQRDARRTSSGDIAGEMDISASTVRNRIQRLEQAGIIRGYHVDIDYEAAGFPLYTKLICTAPIDEREELARRALEVPGVAAVREVMTGDHNVYVNAVGRDHDDLSRLGRELSALGLHISDEELIRNEYVCPYHGFRGADLED
ncbi:Lrp/AsnC family transcriptional regulator [Halomarina ordinaria]|uniref:Lrp/AsnC family transcriptional regulator n=1 Tax=Halomarina ordinaria TaxID=3033939 RepID=A0ABD5U4F0_9EURY|nr:Lrp/AsnC family transcriptional regulator [Halomarina sp. PSRA2]